jgi:protein kinase X
VFRDLKPSNILIDENGYLKICDLDTVKKGNKLKTMCGTPFYVAPEMIKKKEYEKEVDYWALGIITYEISNGILPFTGDNPMEVYEQILNGKIKFPK